MPSDPLKGVPRVETKHCCICDKYKLLTEFHRKSSTTTELENKCKECGNMYHRRAAKRRRDNLKYQDTYEYKLEQLLETTRLPKVIPRGHQECRLCRTILPLTDYRLSDRTKTGFGKDCKQCLETPRDIRMQEAHKRNTKRWLREEAEDVERIREGIEALKREYGIE